MTTQAQTVFHYSVRQQQDSFSFKLQVYKQSTTEVKQDTLN